MADRHRPGRADRRGRHGRRAPRQPRPRRTWGSGHAGLRRRLRAGEGGGRSGRRDGRALGGVAAGVRRRGRRADRRARPLARAARGRVHRARQAHAAGEAHRRRPGGRTPGGGGGGEGRCPPGPARLHATFRPGVRRAARGGPRWLRRSGQGRPLRPPQPAQPPQPHRRQRAVRVDGPRVRRGAVAARRPVGGGHRVRGTGRGREPEGSAGSGARDGRWLGRDGRGLRERRLRLRHPDRGRRERAHPRARLAVRRRRGGGRPGLHRPLPRGLPGRDRRLGRGGPGRPAHRAERPGTGTAPTSPPSPRSRRCTVPDGSRSPGRRPRRSTADGSASPSWLCTGLCTGWVRPVHSPRGLCTRRTQIPGSAWGNLSVC